MDKDSSVHPVHIGLELQGPNHHILKITHSMTDVYQRGTIRNTAGSPRSLSTGATLTSKKNATVIDFTQNHLSASLSRIATCYIGGPPGGHWPLISLQALMINVIMYQFKKREMRGNKSRGVWIDHNDADCQRWQSSDLLSLRKHLDNLWVDSLV